jgi:hypothetical protein
MVELQDIVKDSMDRAHELTQGTWDGLNQDQLNAVVASVQGLLEVAKTAAQLDAVKDAQIIASRRAMEDIRASRRSIE